MKQAQHKNLALRALISAVGMMAAMVLAVTPIKAQYFQAKQAQKQIVKASSYDSVIVERMTPFDVPQLSDSIQFTYHEPMPDSIMPRSAVVIGTISVQAESPEDVTAAIEKYARKNGADWIVSFSEPKASLTKDKYKVYRSSATLLHVLDPNFIQQTDIAYNFYEDKNLQNFAAVNNYYDTYGRHMGAKINTVQDDPNVPDTPEDER